MPLQSYTFPLKPTKKSEGFNTFCDIWRLKTKFLWLNASLGQNSTKTGWKKNHVKVTANWYFPRPFLKLSLGFSPERSNGLPYHREAGLITLQPRLVGMLHIQFVYLLF